MNETAYLSELEFHRLLTYNTTIPTGTTIGKRWKCRDTEEGGWFMGEYHDIGSQTRVGIRWRPIVVVNSSLALEVVLRGVAPWMWE